MGEAVKIQHETWLCPGTCAACGVIFGLTRDFDKQRRDDHAVFYCPNGHQQYYPGKSEAEMLRAQLTAKEREVTFQKEQRQLVERQLAAAKGVTTKLKHRVARGVCPHCQRTFTNVARHMESKHAEEVKTS